MYLDNIFSKPWLTIVPWVVSLVFPPPVTFLNCCNYLFKVHSHDFNDHPLVFVLLNSYIMFQGDSVLYQQLLNCHNKIPQTRCLKQQKFIVSHFCKMEAWNQSANMVRFWWDFFSCLKESHFLTVSLHSREREQASGVSSYKTPISSDEVPVLTTSANPNYLPKAPSPSTIKSGIRASTYKI